MDRRDFVLAVLSPAKGELHTPVQVQKLFFLLDENIPDEIGGKHFHHEPYNYGPFDAQVYEELEKLATDGLVDIEPQQTWRSYRLTPKGQNRGEAKLLELGEKAQRYIEKLSEFVRKLSFSELVSAVYKAYPEMRVKSVFQG